MAFIIYIIDGISVQNFRGCFNHLSLFLVVTAVYIFIDKYYFPERYIKIMILIWFIVSSIQFWVDRSFLTSIIGAANWTSSVRGVLGLASEPSFLGISCFYFLHLIKNFSSKKIFYTILIIIMGIIYAQSTMGIIFILAFSIVYIFNNLNSLKGIFIFIILILFIMFGYYLLYKYANNIRLFQILDTLLNQGITELYKEDASTQNRFNSIINSLNNAINNLLIPQGYGSRIGSGYGGLLTELGWFGLIEIIIISWGMSLQYSKKYICIIYFIIVSVLLFSNTQIGNPQLLFALGINIYNKNKYRIKNSNYIYKQSYK